MTCPSPGRWVSRADRRPAGAQSVASAASVGRKPLQEIPMSLPRPTRRPETGITTAEYAVGTAAGAGLAGLLYKMLTGGFGQHLLQALFDHVLGLLGIR